MTDTGSFRQFSTTAETHKAIAKLVESGRQQRHIKTSMTVLHLTD